MVDPNMIMAIADTTAKVGSQIAQGVSTIRNRRWQTYMSNTAHQREIADLQRAGINPLATAMGGSGASTPSGNTYSGELDTHLSDSYLSGQRVSNEKKMVSLALDKGEEEINKLIAERKSTNALEKKLISDKLLNDASFVNVLKQSNEIDSRTRLNNAQADRLLAEQQQRDFFGSLFGEANNAYDVFKGLQIPDKLKEAGKALFRFLHPDGLPASEFDKNLNWDGKFNPHNSKN